MGIPPILRRGFTTLYLHGARNLHRSVGSTERQINAQTLLTLFVSASISIPFLYKPTVLYTHPVRKLCGGTSYNVVNDLKHAIVSPFYKL